MKRVTKDTGQAFTGLEDFCKEPFCLIFSLENINPSSNRMSSKYVAGKESRTSPTESCDIRKGEIQQFAMCKRQADWCSIGRVGCFNC